ncbi:MAG TPA: hypothetical protein EYQ15_00430 [Candidatus Poseidoniales archaeon]|nr:hypothetical protein [Candidatus Poseidoniales archaeon]
MTKKCLGVDSLSGDRCKRPANSGSDFCFMHKPQEGDARIAYLEHDIYHCPDDGQQLLFVPDQGSYRCDMCGGVLMSAKDIDSEVLEGILELPEVIEEGLSVECPTCSSDNDLSDGETALTNFAVEWYFWIRTSKYTADIYQCGVSNVGHCTVCGSTWFAGPGEFDALGRTLGKNTTRVWRKQFRRLGKKKRLWGISGDIRRAIRTKNTFGVQEQSLLRQARLAGVKTATERKWKEAASRSDNLCNHVDDNGKMCDFRKSTKSTHDQDYCYKHQPK